MMKKIVFWMAVVVLATFMPKRSEAFGAETLGCSFGDTDLIPDCIAPGPSSGYEVIFGVDGESGTYTFNWNITGRGEITIIAGCDSTSDACLLEVPSNRTDKVISVTVTLTQNGQSRMVSTIAEIPAVCGTQDC